MLSCVCDDCRRAGRWPLRHFIFGLAGRACTTRPNRNPERARERATDNDDQRRRPTTTTNDDDDDDVAMRCDDTFHTVIVNCPGSFSHPRPASIRVRFSLRIADIFPNFRHIHRSAARLTFRRASERALLTLAIMPSCAITSSKVSAMVEIDTQTDRQGRGVESGRNSKRHTEMHSILRSSRCVRSPSLSM